MKKKIAVFFISLCTVAMVAGCGGAGKSGSKYSDDYMTLKAYKGLEVAKVDVPKVTDEEVEKNLQMALESKAQRIEVTGRPAKMGDIVIIDYAGTKDGVAFEGGTAQDQELELGSHLFIDGFEEGVVGHNIGETFDLNLKFPEGYQNKDLAGQAVVFTVTLDKISEKKVPELTDELVKELSETAKTVDEFKAEIKKSLEESNKEKAESQQKNAAWEALMEQCEVKKYPEDKLKETVEQIKKEYEPVAQMYQIEDVELFFQQAYSMTSQQMAERVLKQQMVIDAIVKQEKIEVTDEEYKAGLEKYAKEFGHESGAKMEEAVGKEKVENALLQDEVTAWLMDNSKLVEKK